MVHQTQVIENKALHVSGVGKTLHIFASTFVQVSEKIVGKRFPTTKAISHTIKVLNRSAWSAWCAIIAGQNHSVKQGGTLY